MQAAKTNDLIKGIDLDDNYLIASFSRTSAAHLSSEAVNMFNFKVKIKLQR